MYSWFGCHGFFPAWFSNFKLKRKKRGVISCHRRPDLNLTMWWSVLVSQRRHSEVVQGDWRWPGTLGWVEWAPLVLQLWKKTPNNIYIYFKKSELSVSQLSHTQQVVNSSINIFPATQLTHPERWQRHSPSGSQTRWMRYTDRRHWIPFAHC